MVKMRAVVRGYNAEHLRLGDVSFTALKKVYEDKREFTSYPMDFVDTVTKAMRGKYSYVEVEISGMESTLTKIVRGENPSYHGTRPLFYRPARLKRVGILRLSRVREKGFDRQGYATLKLDEDLKWYEVKGEYYVFEGSIEVPQDVVYVVFETEYGRRWVRTRRSAILQPASLQGYERAPQDARHDAGSGGDSSPSG